MLGTSSSALTPQVTNDDPADVAAQFPSNQWTALRYDAAGNVEREAAGTGRSYTYDAENRVKTAAMPGTPAITYSDDGEGRRIRKELAGQATTVFVYDAAGQLAMEFGPAAGAEVQYLTADHLGSTRLVTDKNGAEAKRVDYLPFGEEYPAVGYPSATEKTLVKFTGKERDAETGLDYFGARYMSAAQGRFTSPDPLLASGRPDLPQSWNRYGYVLNNPLRLVDRTGLYEEDVHRDLTVALALAAGISEPIAVRIGGGDQGVDDDPRTSPMGMSPVGEAVGIREAYHFTTPERRAELYGRFESTGSPERLGVFFHAQQDSYSHAGYGARFGHAVDGHAPDKTYTNPTKADRMAANTFSILTGAASKLMGGTQYQPLSAKQVGKFTSAFNRARTSAAKQRVLNQLIRAARENIQKQEEERRKREESGK